MPHSRRREYWSPPRAQKRKLQGWPLDQGSRRGTPVRPIAAQTGARTMNENVEYLPATSHRAPRSPPVTVKLKAIQAEVATFGSHGPEDEAWRRQLREAFGSISDDFLEISLRHLQSAARMPGAGPSELAINGALAMVAAAAPQNEIEAALAVQMACTHMVAMAVMSRIGGAHGGSHRLPGLASATSKLLRAFSSQADTLRRLRTGGDQNIRVEHVHVHKGGQAIVGAVNSRSVRDNQS